MPSVDPCGPKKPKVKDSETFNGAQDQLNNFLTESKLVFELRPSRFEDDRTQVNYKISLLQGLLLHTTLPHLQERPRPEFLNNYAAFVYYLGVNYGDPDKSGTARRKIKALRQTNLASSKCRYLTSKRRKWHQSQTCTDQYLHAGDATASYAAHECET